MREQLFVTQLLCPFSYLIYDFSTMPPIFRSKDKSEFVVSRFDLNTAPANKLSIRMNGSNSTSRILIFFDFILEPNFNGYLREQWMLNKVFTH